MSQATRATPPTPHAAPAATASTAPTATGVPAPAHTADASNAELEARIHSLETYANAHPNDWLDRDYLAQAYLDRARATGDWQDFARAEHTIDEAFHIAPQGSGPFLTRAAFNYTLHRLDRVEPDLHAAERAIFVASGARQTIDTLRADTAYHSGHYDVARRGYEAALTSNRTIPALVSMAQLEWKTGHFDAAQRLLGEASRNAQGRGFRAWVSLVRGLLELDRGRWTDALGFYTDGLAIAPDDYVLQEHQAEVLTLLGQGDRALPTYLSLIVRTGHPEFMDAAAEIYAARGDTVHANELIQRAATVYRQRLALFEEAVAGHAIDHFLHHDPESAVHIAEVNVRARPGGEAQTKLAEAYARVGRMADARRVLDQTLATAWDTAELHAVASIVYAAQGDAARAASERTRALAIDPHSVDSLGWLSHGATVATR